MNISVNLKALLFTIAVVLVISVFIFLGVITNGLFFGYLILTLLGGMILFGTYVIGDTLFR